MIGDMVRFIVVFVTLALLLGLFVMLLVNVFALVAYWSTIGVSAVTVPLLLFGIVVGSVLVGVIEKVEK